MKMEEHIAFLKMLRIPYKEAVFKAFWHIMNEHKDEIDIEDLIKATCVFQRPVIEHPGERFDRRRRRDYRDHRERYY